MELHDLDYYPEPGDEFIWLGRVFQITRAYMGADKFFASTGIPLWITAEAEILRQGDQPVERVQAAPKVAFPAPVSQRLAEQRLSG